MAELLLELLSEEIPARMQKGAEKNLARLLAKALADAGLDHDGIETFSTPRRLTARVVGLPQAQPDVSEERRGPRADAPEQAIEGFLKSAGVARKDCELREEKKGVFLYAVIEKKGQPTSEVLDDVINAVLNSFPWPKSMRWGDNKHLKWVRPLHSILAIFDELPLDGGWSFVSPIHGAKIIRYTNVTVGHRFLAPTEFTEFVVENFADYKAKLENAYVLINREDRKSRILKGAEALAKKAKLELVPDDTLLEEIIGLVEWPVPMLGEFDNAFLELPPVVLVSEMRHHQKYFALQDPKSGLQAPNFIVISNLDTKSKAKTQEIVEGNKRVLSARFSDAKFFWKQDQKVRLEERIPALYDIVFHEKIGSVGDKVGRLIKLSGEIAGEIPNCSEEEVACAAALAKSDLLSFMVGEFPHLQGVMGGYYAAIQGENEGVSTAIREQYFPLGPVDICPSSPTSLATALADNLDTLCLLYAVGERATGSKDPQGLRRLCLSCIRLINENSLRLNLRSIFESVLWNWLYSWDAHEDSVLIIGEPKKEEIYDEDYNELLVVSYPSLHIRSPKSLDEFQVEAPNIGLMLMPGDYHGSDGDVLQTDFDEVGLVRIADPKIIIDDLLAFFADRLKVQQRDAGVRHDLIDAVFSLGGEDDLVRLLARVSALQEFLATDDGENLLAGYKRAVNIVRIEEKKDKTSFAGSVDEALLSEKAEKALYKDLAAARKKADAALDKEDFAGAMAAIAALRAPIDSFFDDVTVNADNADLRTNRLRLLAQIRTSLDAVADFSKIEGS